MSVKIQSCVSVSCINVCGGVSINVSGGVNIINVSGGVSVSGDVVVNSVSHTWSTLERISQDCFPTFCIQLSRVITFLVKVATSFLRALISSLRGAWSLTTILSITANKNKN